MADIREQTTRLRLMASVFVLRASPRHVAAAGRWQMTEIREQREEGERLRRWEGEKKSEIPGPDRIREDSVNKRQPYKQPDMVKYYLI